MLKLIRRQAETNKLKIPPRLQPRFQHTEFAAGRGGCVDRLGSSPAAYSTLVGVQEADVLNEM